MSSEWWDDKNDVTSDSVSGDDGRDHMGGGVSGIGTRNGSIGRGAGAGAARGSRGGLATTLPPTERSRRGASLTGTGGAAGGAGSGRWRRKSASVPRSLRIACRPSASAWFSLPRRSSMSRR
jgi:hypothetical protein